MLHHARETQKRQSLTCVQYRRRRCCLFATRPRPRKTRRKTNWMEGIKRHGLHRFCSDSGLYYMLAPCSAVGWQRVCLVQYVLSFPPSPPLFPPGPSFCICLSPVLFRQLPCSRKPRHGTVLIEQTGESSSSLSSALSSFPSFSHGNDSSTRKLLSPCLSSKIGLSSVLPDSCSSSCVLCSEVRPLQLVLLVPERASVMLSCLARDIVLIVNRDVPAPTLLPSGPTPFA